MSIFCEKRGCFTLPGGVCMRACVCVCVCVHEWWGIWQSESRFNNNWYIPGCFQTSFQLGAVCDASRPQSEREKRWERERERERERKVRRNDEERQRMKKAHKMKKRGGKVWADICLASFHLACSLTNHSPPPSSFIKKEEKWHRSSDKGKHPNHTNPPRHPCLTLLHFSEALPMCVCVRVCVIFWGCIFSQASGLTQRDVEMNPVPLPGFYSLRDIEASHTL